VRPMGKTPISPLVWVSALSRESKEVTKPTSRSVASARTAPGICLSHGRCHMAIDCHMAFFHMAIVCHIAIVHHMAFVCHARTCLLGTMSKRHMALAVFEHLPSKSMPMQQRVQQSLWYMQMQMCLANIYCPSLEVVVMSAAAAGRCHLQAFCSLLT